MQVRKAVITAAGFGTRFLPATKAQPKEMLPVVDRPAIQYQVEEAVRAGIEDILMVTARGKRSIEDHFDRNEELELILKRAGKVALLEEIRSISDLAQIHYVRQKKQMGLGHAVLTARHHVGAEPFVVMLGDEIIWGPGLLEGMIEAQRANGGCVIAVRPVDREKVSAYGVIDPESQSGPLVKIKGMVEKPQPDDAPSNLIAIGRYVLTPEIFDALEHLPPGAGGEIQLTDAIAEVIESQDVYGYVYEGARFDIGRKPDFLRANVELALYREDLGPEVREMLRDICARHGIV
jgi:UTP--glucose-1-phosphate uridylyltransferase